MSNNPDYDRLIKLMIEYTDKLKFPSPTPETVLETCNQLARRVSAVIEYCTQDEDLKLELSLRLFELKSILEAMKTNKKR